MICCGSLGRVYLFNYLLFKNLIHSAFITPALLNQIINELPANTFNICLDLGHSNCVGIKPEDFIKQLQENRLQALHVHDNFGKEDIHVLPYMGNINWRNTVRALKDYGYKHDFTLEIEGFLRDINVDNAFDKYKKAFNTGVELIKYFN